MPGPFTRFVGRLPVGRKLLLIYLLDLTAVIYISGILINEKYIAINFARKELAGNAYIAQIRDSLLALPVPIGALPQEARPVDGTAVQAWIAGAAAAEAAHGAEMKSAAINHALTGALARLAETPSVDRAMFDAALDAHRALIARIGDQSNMILDPDLDSYYTMSLVLLRFPEIVELLARAAQKSVEAARADGERRSRAMTELLILEGRLDAATKGMASDFAAAVAAGPAWLEAGLEPAHEALLRDLAAFRGQADRVDADAPAAQLAHVAAQHAQAVAGLQSAWRAASAGLDRLVQARIDHLVGRMWLHLGTAAALLVVILGLVYFVARQISKPIRQLAGVADQVSRSGDYSMRAGHDSPDEIGQLVRAFNGMLGELDRDRAVREDMAATLRAEEAQRALLTAIPTALIVTSVPDHRILHANEPAQPWLNGVSTNPWASCLDSPTRARYFQRLADIGWADGFEVRWQTGAGAQHPSGGSGARNAEWALLSGRQLTFQGQSAILTAITPIGQIKLLEQRLQLWAKVFEASSESIIIFDADQRILNANEAFRRATGWDVSDVAGQKPDFLYSARHDAAFYDTLWHGTVIRGSWQGEVWLKRKNGQVYPTWMVANAVRGADGRLSHLVAAAVDITDHKSSEARIHHLAHHDALTDLPNRALCMERLRMAVEQAERSGLTVAVVFIDLDRFKTINDSMGHHVGDALLRSVAKRLLQAVRAGDTVSRLGGDEFVVVLNGARNVEEIADVVNERMLALIRQPHAAEGLELNVVCSAGIAVFPADGRDIDHLMRNADAAMYQAKSAGRNQAVFFAPEFHVRAQERHLIENALPQAVERGELRLHFQPRIDARSGDVVGVEALLRWLRPEHGLLLPARFIPVAEETGQIVDIGTWVIGEATRQHAVWRDGGLGEIAVSVNVSAIQLRDLSLPRVLESALRRHAMNPAMLELELTETALMDNALATVTSLNSLKALGVTLSIDDFGTGYSSLNYLHQFPIDKLKIDQSFVRDMLAKPADLAITQAIIGLGHTLGLRVVAEGVEGEAEGAMLREFGCDEFQGHLYAEPMPAEQFAAWVDSSGPGDRAGKPGHPDASRTDPEHLLAAALVPAQVRSPCAHEEHRGTAEEFSGSISASRSEATAAAAEDEGRDGQHDEDQEQDFGNARGAGGDATETEERSDQGDDEEDDGIVKHGVLR